MSQIFTRADYMERRCSHEDYYGQFATPAVVEYVARHIGKDRIIASTDRYLNDIPLFLWDQLSGFCLAQNDAAIREAGGHWSLSDGVCIAKAAARKIKAGA